LSGQKRKPDKKKLFKILTYNGFNKKGVRDFINFFGRRIFGVYNFDKIKSFILHKPPVVAKEFNINDVNSIVSRITDVDKDDKPAEIDRVRNKHTCLKMIAKDSIRMVCN
jgi:hypothetical protein